MISELLELASELLEEQAAWVWTMLGAGVVLVYAALCWLGGV
jgi:hypothetical protein